MTKLNLNTFYRPSTLGYERILNEIEKVFESIEKPVVQNTYPPHNIIKADSNRYVVELAVAGFTKDEIDVTVEDGYLKIKGSKTEGTPNVEYLHRGIGTRSFTKTIQIADTIEVRGAELNDGILRVGLENVIPDHKKSKKIKIGTLEFQKQLLNG